MEKTESLCNIINPNEKVLHEFIQVVLNITNENEEVLQLEGVLANSEKRLLFKIKSQG